MNPSDLKIFFCARFDVERSPSQSESEVIPPPSYAQVIDLNKWAIFWLNCLWELPVLGLNAIKNADSWWFEKNIGFQKMNPITYNSITRSSVLKGYLKFIQEPSEVPSAPTRYESREARLQIYGKCITWMCDELQNDWPTALVEFTSKSVWEAVHFA